MSSSLCSSVNASGSRSPIPQRHISHTRIDHASDIEKYYELGTRLGKGSFGSVSEATRMSDGTKWAVKIINKEKAGSAQVKLLEHEVKIMKKVNHKSIIHLEEVFESSEKMLLVMELCSKEGLEEILRKKGFFSEEESLGIFKQLADAVSYMHENEITHRDLKLDNILLGKPTKDFQYPIKLADFGLSYTRGSTGSDYMMTQAVGTPIYMAPEVLTNYRYSQQCDIWSIGIVLHILLTGKPPFIANNEEELNELIKKGQLNFSTKQWSNISPAAKQLLEGMLKVDPAHRLTSKEVLCQPWLKGEQNVSSVAPMNVLEMMKQCRLEQSGSGNIDLYIPCDDNNNIDFIDLIAIDDQEKCASKSNSPKPESSSIPVTTKETISAIKKPTSKIGVPNYMQPTKSSISSKMTIKPNNKK